ncbi:hypothetical protein BASA50_008647 [Batrachochytrium salamandrivorans]|uniref:Pentacotripeptide-repeat region of PRORP domain-containing protein n=1 Tax=Batrachochytrium salamandrivorans TaxID=1357716 RepID=A0ABQ8F3Q2_9FUNG|nr:hypothetical protein BASA50_008647 [Batrachochytrium salamandrivorans]
MKQVRHHSSRFLTQRSRRSVVVPAGSTKRKAIQRDKSLFEHATGRKCSRCASAASAAYHRHLCRTTRSFLTHHSVDAHRRIIKYASIQGPRSLLSTVATVSSPTPTISSSMTIPPATTSNSNAPSSTKDPTVKNVEFDGLISTRKPNSLPPKRFICEETGRPLATEHMPKPFRTLIEQLHKGKMEAAHATFSEIEKTDPEMLTVLTIAGFNRIIEAVSDKTLHILQNYSSKQRVARTREILSRMESSGRKPNNATFEHLLAMYSKQGDLDSIKYLIAWMRSRRIPINDSKSILRSLIFVNVAAGIKTNTMSYFNKLRLLEPQSAAPFNFLMQSYAENNENDNVLNTFALLRDSGIKPTMDTFALVANVYFARHDFTNARTYIDLCKKQFITPEDDVPYLTPGMYHILLSILNDQSSHQEARQVVDHMNRVKVRMNLSLQCEDFISLVAVCPSKDFSEKKSIWLQYTKLPTSLTTNGRLLKSLAHKLGSIGELQTIALLKEWCLEFGFPYSTSLVNLVGAYVSIKDFDTAKMMVDQLVASEISVPIPAYTRIIHAYADLGDISNALAYLETAALQRGSFKKWSLFYVLGKAMTHQSKLVDDVIKFIRKCYPDLTIEQLLQRGRRFGSRTTKKVSASPKEISSRGQQRKIGIKSV